MDVYGLRPVNKTAGVVTSQNGVTDNFLHSDREILKTLGNRKKHFMDALIALKEEIGIDRSREKLGAKTKYPPRIVRHPKFRQMKALKESITNLDTEIKAVRDRIAKNPDTFQEDFINLIRLKYPEIYQEIKAETRKVVKGKGIDPQGGVR